MTGANCSVVSTRGVLASADPTTHHCHGCDALGPQSSLAHTGRSVARSELCRFTLGACQTRQLYFLTNSAVDLGVVRASPCRRSGR